MKNFLALVVALSFTCAHAETRVWVGPTRQSFNNPEYWSPQGIPTAEDDIEISGGKVVSSLVPITVKSLTLSGEGTKLILGDASLVPQTIAAISGDFVVTNSAVLEVYAAELPDKSVFADAITDQTEASAAIYANPTVVSVGGVFSVSEGAVVYPENAPETGASVFFKPKDFVLGKNGRFDTRRRGWDIKIFASEPSAEDLPAGAKFNNWEAKKYCYSFAFGVGTQYGLGAGYGGAAIKSVKVSHTVPFETTPWYSGVTYGNQYAPYLSGSPGGQWGGYTSRGSGAIVVLATGSATVAGMMEASGKPHDGYTYIPGASGGSIWICAANVDLAETSVLCASGGVCRATYAESPGGGGRIAVCSKVGASDWDVLAQSQNGLPFGYVAENLSSPGTVSVAGAPNPTGVKYAANGTAVRVTSSANSINLTVASTPVAVVAEGLSYGNSTVSTLETIKYSVPQYGGDPADPYGIRYPCVGWTVANSKGVVASGEGCIASFDVDWRDGAHSLTWRWGEPFAVRTYRIHTPGCGKIAVNGEEYDGDVALRMDGAAREYDVLSAYPAEGCRFVGWSGLPGGFSTNVTVSVPVESGGLVTAMFESVAAEPSTKTWTNASGSGLWDCSTNWSPEGVPTFADDVVISGGDCHVPFSLIARSLSVAAGSTLYCFATNRVSDTSVSPDPLANNAVARKHRHVYVSGDLNAAGNVVFGGSGAAWTNMSIVVGGNLSVSGNSTMMVFAVPMDETLENNITNIYRGATVFPVGGDVAITGSATLKPVCDKYTGTSVRFDVAGSFLLSSGAEIDAAGSGWHWRKVEGGGDPMRKYAVSYEAGNDTASIYETRSSGAGSGYTIGAGHGNYGNANWKTPEVFGQVYGNPVAPFLPGSPGGLFNVAYPPGQGGGVVWIASRGVLDLSGRITANAADSFYSGSSGGSVWLAGRGINSSKEFSVSAKGGRTSDTQAYTSAGSGGRICVMLGASSEELYKFAMGETPEGFSFGNSTDMFVVDVSGGAEGTRNGTLEQRYAPAGTFVIARGRNADKTVLVTARILAGAPSPAYGSMSVAPGETMSFVASPSGYGADPADPAGARWACTGYVVSNATEEIARGSASSFSMEMPEEDVVVTWLWGGREVSVGPGQPVGGGLASFRIDGAEYGAGDKVWKLADEEFLLEAVPESGSEFLYWAGDFAFGKALDNPIAITASSGLNIYPVVRKSEVATARHWLKTDNGVGDFTDPTAWSGGNIPGLDDDVVIDSGNCFSEKANFIKVRSLVVSNVQSRLYVGFSASSGILAAMNGLPYVAQIESANYLFAASGENILKSALSPNADEVSLVVSEDITVACGAEVCVGIPYFGHKAHGRVAAGNILLADNSQLGVVAGSVGAGEKFTAESGSGFVDVSGSFTVKDSAVFRPFSNGRDGGSVKTEASSFILAAGASIDACGTGFVRYSADPLDCTAPGRGYMYQIGGGYGGRGAYEPSLGLFKDSFGATYGRLTAPVHPGSPNGEYNSPYMRGGGLVRIHADTMSIAGKVNASAQERRWENSYFFGGASGGGIWLTAMAFNFAPGAVLDVHGGYSTYESVGGGGRIAIGEVARGSVVDRLASGDNPKTFSVRSKAEFDAEYPGVEVNVACGVWYSNLQNSSEHTRVEQEHLGEDGTFAYVKRVGSLLIIR